MKKDVYESLMGQLELARISIATAIALAAQEGRIDDITNLKNALIYVLDVRTRVNEQPIKH